MSASGSPATATTSARLPTSSVPVSFPRRAQAAAVFVVATMACIGVMPSFTMSASSSAFVPCSPTPVSVPIAISTPIFVAMVNIF